MYPATLHSLVGGKEYRTTEVFSKYDPATGDTLAHVSRAGASCLEDALTRAVHAQHAWRSVPLSERATCIEAAIRTIEKRLESLTPLIAQETGRSIKNTRGELQGAIRGGRYLLEHLDALAPREIESATPGRTVTLVREPVGVGAVFTPFNSPFVLLTGKVFPALLAGNGVVIKAHELAPYTPLLFADVCREAGVSPDLLAVLQGGAEIGEALVRDSRVAWVSLTGSPTAGSAILSATASRLTRVSIEAGGKNPFVVLADADLDRAVTLAVQSAFVDGGQRCAAASRIIVERPVYDEFVKRFVEQASTLGVGVSESSTYGAIISEARLKELVGCIAEATERGTCLLQGTVQGPGYFLTPTIVEGVSPDERLAQEELFGPIVLLFKADSFDHALELANNSRYRLTSAIHTNDEAVAERFAREHGAGVTRVNGPTFGSEPHMPFGGDGLSGNGWREPGVEAFQFYTSLRQVSRDQ